MVFLFYTKVIESVMCFETHFLTSLHWRRFLPIIGKFTLFLNSYIQDMHRNAAQLEHYYIKQRRFCSNVFLESKHYFLRILLHLFLATRILFVIYNLDIYFLIMVSFPQLSG